MTAKESKAVACLTYKAYPFKHPNGTSIVYEADPAGMWVNAYDHAEAIKAIEADRDEWKEVAMLHGADLNGLHKELDAAESALHAAEAESRIVNLENSVAAMRHTRDDMQRNLIALQSRLDAVLLAGRELDRAYVRLIESGRDRIRDLGGECDPVDVMERSDIDLRKFRAALGGESPGNEEVVE